MGIIQVPGRLSGRTYNIEIAGDTPTAAEQERIRAGVEERESRFAQRYEAAMGNPLAAPDDGTAIGRGYERGKANIKSTLGTTVETLGQQTGIASLADYGRSMENAATMRQLELSLLQPPPTTRQDVAAAEGFFPTVGKALSYAGEVAGEQIPQFGASLVGGAAGAVGGGLAAGAPGAVAGFGVGSGLVEAPMLFGSNVQRQEEEVAAGRKPEVDLSSALGATVGQTAITAVTNALAGAGVFLRPGASLFTRVASGAAVGGSTESLNEIGQQVLERYQAGLPVDSPDAISEYIDAGVAGGILGVGAGGLAGVAGRKRAEAPAAAAEPTEPLLEELDTPTQIPADVLSAAAEELQGTPEVAAPTPVEAAIATAQDLYDERVAVAMDSGASEAEANQVAARSALSYIDTLPPEAQAELVDFKELMAKRAAAPARGVMQPPVPDDVYAAAVEPPIQGDLFAPKPVPAPAPAPSPMESLFLPEEDSDADAFERASAQYAPVTRPAVPPAPAPEPKYRKAAEEAAPKPAQVLTDEIVTQLGVRPAKSAPLRKLVGSPVQDSKVIRALDSWAQNPKTTPEQKALASSLITGQPVQNDLFAAPRFTGPVTDLEYRALSDEDKNTYLDEIRMPPAPDAPKAAAGPTSVVPTETTQEVANDSEVTTTQPEEVGAGVSSDRQGVAGLGQPDGDVQPAEGPAAPAEGGLGGDLSVPVGADTAAGAEPNTLTPPAPPAPLGPPPSLTRPVVPLRRMGPGIPPTPMLKKPQSSADLDVVLANRYSATTPLNVKRGAQLLNEAGAKLSVKDPLTVADKRAVIGLLATRGSALSPQAAAAKLYFSKVARPIDAILMVVDDLTAPYKKYRAEPNTPTWQREFMQGTGRDAAKNALEFIRARMSPEVQNEVNFRISLSAQQNKNQKTWLSDLDRVELEREARKKAREMQKEAAVESGYIAETMPSADALAALDRQMHYSVVSALQSGDLKGALTALAATTNNAELAKLAARFAELTGTTRVKVLYPGDPAKNIGSHPGVYWAAAEDGDPERQNIIYLNGEIGMNAHVLMHEMAHAVTADLSYRQPNHPAIKQLETLLAALRKEVAPPSLRGKYPPEFYGLTNLREFMAEAYGRVALGDTDGGLRDLMKRRVFTEYTTTNVEQPLTYIERFKEIVGNLLRNIVGLPSRPYPRRTKAVVTATKETAADRFHRLIDGVLTTAPQVLPDSVFQRAISEPAAARTTLNNMLQVAPKWDAAGMSRTASLMQASIPMPARRFVLGLLHLDWFNDLAGKYFPQIAELKRVDDLRRGEIVRQLEQSKPVLEDLQAYAEKNPELMSKLMAIQGRATVEQVDPTAPVGRYAGDKNKARVWHELNRELTSADHTGEMRALYKTVRNMYLEYRKAIEDTLKERIKDISDDVATQNQLFARLMAKIDEEGVLDPYFALMRKGDYWLSYTAEDTTAEPIAIPGSTKTKRPPTQYVQAFESVWDREAFRNKLAALKDDRGDPVAYNFEEFPRPVSGRPSANVPTSFVQGAINIINSTVPKSGDVDAQMRADAAIQSLEDMFVRFTPEHSLLKSFIKRKGTRGFIGDITPLGVVDRPLDMVQALAEKSSSLAYQLANMKYGTQIQRLRNAAEAQERKLQGSGTLTPAESLAVRAYYEEFDDRAKFAQSPNVGAAAQAIRGVTFGMTLGFSIAGAVNNLFQIPMIGAPELGGRYGLPAAIRALGSAATLLKNAGKTAKTRSYGPDGMVTRDISGVDHYGSMANYFEVDDSGALVVRKDRRLSPELRKKLDNLDVLVEVMSANGMLANSMAQEMLEADAGWLQKINKWSGFLMHHAERFNRQVMAIAAYNLELGKAVGPLSYEAKLAAAKKAVEITERVNGSIGASTAPRLSQSGIGSVVFMFKRFGIHMARYIINTANEAVRGKDPRERKIARYQITGMLGTTALFAGVQGLPFFGEIMSLINLFFTDDGEEPAEVLVEKFMQEPFYHGAINYLTGAEVATRISMSGLIFRENKLEKDQSILYDMFETLGGPAVGVFMNGERAVDLLSQGELYRGVEAMMPSAIKSGMKAVRFGTEGATTLRGDEVVPLSYGDIFVQALGYIPAEYARMQERVSDTKRIDEAIRQKKRKLLRKYNMALAERDFDTLRELLREMQEFSREYPEAAITGDTLKRSSTSFAARSKDMIGGVTFTPSGLPRARQNIDEYDEDISIWAE